MRRIQIDTTVEYADEIDGIIAELADLRATMVSQPELKARKKKRSKRNALRSKEELTWNDIFKILRRHHETDSQTTRRTCNLIRMLEGLVYSDKIGFVVRCTSCTAYVPTPSNISVHDVGCPGRTAYDGTTRILYVERQSVLDNHAKVATVTPTRHTAAGRMNDLALLAGFLEGKVK